MNVPELVEQLIESPWEAEDLLAPLGAVERAAVREQLLARAQEDPSNDVMQVLGQFPDAEVLAALREVLRSELDDDVQEGAAEGIAEMKTLPAAAAALRELVDHSIDGVARIAIEDLEDPPEAIVELLLARIDAIARRGEDLLMAAVVAKLVEAAPSNPEVVGALARHWDFGIVHHTTYFAANAIFDALIDHAPSSAAAQAAFEAAVAHEHEYAKVRGHGALALTTDNIREHVTALENMKGLQPSGSSLRKSALEKLVKTRKAALERLAGAGDKLAIRLLKPKTPKKKK
jgi:hypothetical protein